MIAVKVNARFSTAPGWISPDADGRPRGFETLTAATGQLGASNFNVEVTFAPTMSFRTSSDDSYRIGQRLGCGAMQGYLFLFGKPVPEEQIRALLRAAASPAEPRRASLLT